MNRWICCTVSILAMALISGVLAFGQGFPNCRWNCRSNDVALEEIYLEGPSTCLAGEMIDATLYGMFVNGTGTERYDVAFLADLVITSAAGATVTELTVTNLTASIPPGAASLPIADISFPCGADVELRDVVVSWDTKEGGDLACSARAVKCSMNPSIVVHDTPLPLVAEFSSSSVACVEELVSFINQTTGGTASSYSWDFGDGVGSSTNANPTYAFPSEGTYTVSLTVTDSGTSSNVLHDIEIGAAPDADARNGGPYCPGDTIELFADGGTSYTWTGPGGFASWEQNPTIPDGEAGIYTVTVSNAAGCSSSASTNVVVDSVDLALSLPADATVECGDDVSPAFTGQATASDLTGASVSITYVDAFVPDGCSDDTGSIQRTWTGTDSCGNTSSEVQAIAVVDTTAPSLAISSLSFECDGAGNVSEIETWLQSAAVSDTCGDVVVSHDYTGLAESCPGVGDASVTFVAADSCGNATQRTATVSVLDTTPPIAVADTAITDEDVGVQIDVLHNDSDACGSVVVLLSAGTPSSGVVEIVGEQVRYTPPVGFDGTDSFSYTVADCGGLQSTGHVEVTVLARNDAPKANEALLTILEDVAASLTLTASDPDGDVLTYGILNGPSHGTIIDFDAAAGTMTYIPDPNFHGEDTFTFEACDPDGACGSATVTVAVESVDDPPVADKQEVDTPEDTAIAIQVTGSDVDGEALTYSIVSGPSRGTISGFDETTGELIYTPAQHYTGTDAFVFDVSDSHAAHGRSQGTVTIMVTPVNDAPVASDQTRATSEDTATGFFALAIEDPDNALVELECDCVEPPQHGSIERGPDHTVNYTPDLDYTGTDTFTYIVCDRDDLCDTATVEVTISATNDNPSVTASNQTTPEDTPIDIPVTHSDPDGDTLTCTASTPSHGTVSPQLGTIDGPYPETGTLTYTPEADFVGVGQIVLQCNDGNGGSESVTIEITVTPVNDRPEANDVAVTMPEDTSATITMTGSDPDLDVLSFEIVGGPSHGTITGLDGATGPDSCGSCHTAGSSVEWATGGVSADHLTYTPAQDYYGTDEIIFQTCDSSGACDTGVVTIVVEPADDNPIPDPQAVTTPEDVAKGIVLTAVEPDGEALTYEIVSEPSHGTITGFDEETGDLIYVPDENYVGTDSFVFEACDPDAEHGCPQATVSITVTPVNDPPNAAADTFEITFEDSALPIILPGTDVDGDNLVFSILSGPINGSIDILDPLAGSYVYTPNPDFNGIDESIYEICDPSGACDQGFVHIDVLSVNDEPVAQSSDRNTFQDTPIDIQLTATDEETPDLVFSLALSPRHGALLNWDEATGEVRYQPEPGYVGSDSFLFRVCDPDGACDTALVNIDVIDVNDSPQAAYLETTVNQGELTPLVARATDPDGEPLTFSLVSQPVHGSVVSFDPSTGEFEYASDDIYIGPDIIRFEVCDISGACDVGVIQLNVIPAGEGGGLADDCPKVAISEIAWAGTAAGADDEWIELRNLEAMPVRLEGWFLRWRDITATEPEDQAWRVLPLTGSLEAYQEDAPAAFESNASLSNSWWFRWTTAPSPDHFIVERGDDETILPKVADQVYPMKDEFGLLTRLPDGGAVVELIAPAGCLVDTANIDWPLAAGWSAGSTAPPASMERVSFFAEDGVDNWHSNLGLIRAEFDAFGNLLHGTPGVANSPIMAQIALDLEYEPTSHPMGDPIVIPFGDQKLLSEDSQLWHVVVTQGIHDDVLPVEWDVIKQGGGSIEVIIQTNWLPLNTTFYAWVRTPTGDVLFAPYLLYPY